jgi:hypothetical protein
MVWRSQRPLLMRLPGPARPAVAARPTVRGLQMVFVRSVSYGAPEEIRTPDPQIRSLVLYPAELRALLVPKPGPESPVASDGE